VAGFGDLREVELLVEAGFTPWKRSRLPSAPNFSAKMSASARSLRRKARSVVVKRANISDIEKSRNRFKDGIAWDTEKR
jgi:hypothetical protein